MWNDLLRRLIEEFVDTESISSQNRLGCAIMCVYLAHHRELFISQQRREIICTSMLLPPELDEDFITQFHNEP